MKTAAHMSLHLSEMSLAHILERSSVGICLLCVGLVLLLWNSQRVFLLCVFPFLVYEETYTCLSIVGLRVVQQVATLESWHICTLHAGFSWPTLPRWPMRVGRRYGNWSTKPR